MSFTSNVWLQFFLIFLVYCPPPPRIQTSTEKSKLRIKQMRIQNTGLENLGVKNIEIKRKKNGRDLIESSVLDPVLDLHNEKLPDAQNGRKKTLE